MPSFLEPPKGAALAAEGLRVVVEGAQNLLTALGVAGVQPVVVIDESELERSAAELASLFRRFFFPETLGEDASIRGGTYQLECVDLPQDPHLEDVRVTPFTEVLEELD